MLIEHRRAGVSLEDIYLSIELRPEVEMRLRHTDTLAVTTGPAVQLPVARERRVSGLYVSMRCGGGLSGRR